MKEPTKLIYATLQDLETRELEKLIVSSSFGNKNASDSGEMLFHRILFDIARQTLQGRNEK